MTQDELLRKAIARSGKVISVPGMMKSFKTECFNKEEKPFAWFHYLNFNMIYHDVWEELLEDKDDWVPLYTRPNRPLTDKTIDFIWGNSNPTNFEARSFARAIEKAHGIKE